MHTTRDLETQSPYFSIPKKILYIRTHPEELLAHIVWKHGILSIFYQYVSFGHNFFCSQLSSHYIEFYLKKERGVLTDEFLQFLK